MIAICSILAVFISVPSVSISKKANCGKVCRAFAVADNLALCIKVFPVSNFIGLSIGILTSKVNFLEKLANCNSERRFVLKELIQFSTWNSKYCKVFF